MKGKYATRATINRDWAALERRATEAERLAAQQASELEELKLTHTREIAALRNTESALRLQRDEVSAPAVTAAREQLADMTTDRDRLDADFKRLRKGYLKLTDMTVGLLREQGYPAATADAALLIAVPQVQGLFRVLGKSTLVNMKDMHLPVALLDATAKTRDQRTAGAYELARRLEALGTDIRKRVPGPGRVRGDG